MHRQLLITLLISLVNLISGQLQVTTVFDDITLDYKSTRIFTCRASGPIRSTNGFKWFHDSAEVTNAAGLVSLNARGDTMTILEMSRNLAGDYQCVVYGNSNQEQRSNIFKISYRGLKPGEVTVPKATAVRGSESTEVVISWSLPKDMGFNLASDLLYTVKLCVLPGITSCGTKKTGSLSATMSVVPDKQYSVIITTSTKTGVEGNAATLIYTTPLCSSSEYRCPGEKKCIRNSTASTQICDGNFDCKDKSDEDDLCKPPKSVELVDPEVGTASSIIVRWEKPGSTDRITGYQILLNTGYVERFDADGNTVEREIKNLSPNTEYTATIRARNPSGYGKSTTEKYTTDKGPVGYAIDIETYSKKYIQFMKWKPPTQTGGVSLKELIYTISWNKKGEDNIRFSQNITGGRLEYNIPMDNYKNRDNFDYSFSVINGAKVDGNKTVNNTFVFKPREPFEFLSIEVFRTYIVLAWPSHVPPDIVNEYKLVLNGTLIKLASDVTDYNITGLKMDTYYKIDLTRDNGDRDDEMITTTQITKNCAPGEFQCKSGECLKSFGQVCNSFNDCADGSDEHHDYAPANCKQPGEVDFNITAQYKGLKIHLLNLNGSLTATVVVNVNGRTGDLIKLPNGQQIRGIQRQSQFGALIIQDRGFSSSILSTVYVYGNSLSGNGPILSKTARTLGPIALPPELIKQGTQSLEVEFPGLPGINELSLEAYTIQYKNTNDNNKLNKTETIKTSARPLKRLFSGLEYNTTYSFRYKVEDSDGESDYSPWIDFKTKERELPGEPQNVLVKPRRSEIDLTWDKAPGQGVLGYMIQYKNADTQSSWRNAKTENVTGTFYTIKALSPVTSYDVRIAAVNDKGHGEFVGDNTKTDENICPGYDWKYYAPYCYYRGPFGLDGKTFETSRSDCLEMGADLVSIQSGEENMNVLYEVKRKPIINFSYFNGLQRSSKSDFAWSDGASFSYSQIDQNQNYDPRRQCVAMLTKEDNQFAWAYERCSSRTGYICKRQNVNDKPLSLKLTKTGYNSLTFELPKTSLNRKPKYTVDVVDLSTSSLRTMNVSGTSDSQEFTLEDLQPDTEYSVTVQEATQGLGPKTKIEKFATRVFLSPSKIEKVEHETVQHAESRQQKLTWEYGELGDSMKEDVYVRVKYCTTKRCRTIDFNGTSGVIEELNRKTKYNYTVQVRDRTFMKFSKISVGKEFTTEEKDTCKDGHWLCTDGWKCIENEARCDNVFDCPSDVIGTSADEQKGAGCTTPKQIKINGTIGGKDFLRLYWEKPAKDQRVRGYTVEVNDGEAEYFVEGNQTSFRVSYLPKGSLVTYTILAFNPTGDGAQLRGSQRLANKSDATSAARDVKADDGAEANENTQRLITWKIPNQLNNNDPVTVRYDIQLCHTDKGEKICKQESVTNKLQYTVESLKPSKNYTVVVTAINEYKQSSPPSNKARFVTTLCNREQYECRVDGTCVTLNMTCDGIKNCPDAADEKAGAGCKLAPNVVIKEDTTSDKSITVKYEKLNMRANQILFTLSTKADNSFLQGEQVRGEATLEDGTVTFTKGVKADTEYVVKAVVVNFVGENDGVELTIKTPKENALPSAPRDVTFTKIENLESSSVEVKWDTPSITGGVSKSELKFKIKYCTIPGDSDDEIKCDELVTDAGSTRAVVKELKADTKYKFEVTAYSSDTTKGDKVTANYKTLSKDTCKDKTYYRCPIKCLSPKALCDGVIDCIDRSDETIAAKCAAPEKVEEVTAEATWNALKLSWKEPVNHALQYHLTFQCTVNNKQTPVIKVSVEKKLTSYTFGDLTDTRDVATCDVSVVPENFVGVGPETKGTFKTSPLGKPSSPKEKKITKVGGFESTRVNIEWEEPTDLGNANPKELKYKIEWCEKTKDNPNCKDKNVDDTKVMLKELEAGKQYDVTVTPINPLGQLGEPLKLKFQTSEKDRLPSAPTNIKISRHREHPRSKAFVEWTSPKEKSGLTEEEIKYKLIYCIQPGKECVEIDLDAGVQNHTLVNLKSSEMYEIRLAAFGRSGTAGSFSNNFIHRTDGSGDSDSEGLEGWEIALIIIGIILLLLIIIIAVVVYTRRRSRKPDTYETSGNEKSKMNDGYQDEKV